MDRAKHRLIAAAIAFAAVLALANIAQSVHVRRSDQQGNDASRRFVVLVAFQNKAVLDRETQLVWQRSPSLEEAVWMNASKDCRWLGIGGRSGWRLPSVGELASLVGTDGRLPSGHPFVNLADEAYYWSGTIHESGSHVYAKQLGQTGPLARLATDRSHVLCVRHRGGGPMMPDGQAALRRVSAASR